MVTMADDGSGVTDIFVVVQEKNYVLTELVTRDLIKYGRHSQSQQQELEWVKLFNSYDFYSVCWFFK